MNLSHHQVCNEIVGLMSQLAGDWQYSGEVTPDTRLLGDLALQSLDLVVLGTAIQERYGRLPFSEFLAEIGQRPLDERDVTVGELVEFVCRYSGRVTVGGVV